jgi:uncharacterized protein
MAPEAEKRPSTSEPSRAKCVICGKPREARYDPFCSKRCADVDLNRWFKGSYVIPGGEPTNSDSEDEE